MAQCSEPAGQVSADVAGANDSDLHRCTPPRCWSLASPGSSPLIGCNARTRPDSPTGWSAVPLGRTVDTDAIVERILTTYDTITVVGASAAPAKAAHSVPAHMQQHGWRIIPVNPHAGQILGERVYRELADV